jgi:hypothetical protein
MYKYSRVHGDYIDISLYLTQKEMPNALAPFHPLKLPWNTIFRLTYSNNKKKYFRRRTAVEV